MVGQPALPARSLTLGPSVTSTALLFRRQLRLHSNLSGRSLASYRVYAARITTHSAAREIRCPQPDSGPHSPFGVIGSRSRWQFFQRAMHKPCNDPTRFLGNEPAAPCIRHQTQPTVLQCKVPPTQRQAVSNLSNVCAVIFIRLPGTHPMWLEIGLLWATIPITTV